MARKTISIVCIRRVVHGTAMARIRWVVLSVYPQGRATHASAGSRLRIFLLARSTGLCSLSSPTRAAEVVASAGSCMARIRWVVLSVYPQGRAMHASAGSRLPQIFACKKHRTLLAEQSHTCSRSSSIDRVVHGTYPLGRSVYPQGRAMHASVGSRLRLFL